MAASVILASRSPRRRLLLEQLGIPFKTVDIELNEAWDGKESARAYVSRVALAKALAGWQKVKDSTSLPVLGADTVVVLDDEILGKPRDKEEALRMLAALSGRSHAVYSAVALAGPIQAVRVNVSRVSFCPLSEAERLAYWETGEGLGKAGGYAIQGRAAAFVDRIEGSYSGIVGLPLRETAQLLHLAGVLCSRRSGEDSVSHVSDERHDQ
ncbi:MAG: Maf family nucleotide pyrophosphatase [Gammaproteobacteria bacterium]|nr:Maf family nucleotide pyrophosphatase [Gammaproteobacteria bacterium]MCI0590765.1 Maf family nucleotide pyrophosphatase [Gammaproteobacteria bacterium]